MTVRRFGFLALAVIGLAAAVPSAHATPILPNAVGVVPDAGTLMTAAVAGPTTTVMTINAGADVYKLELTSAVYPEGKLVPGGLTFSWQVKFVSSTTGTGFVNSLSFFNFTGAAILGSGDVQYVAGTGMAPSSAIWDGSSIGFTFANITPGGSSAQLLFHTRSLGYSKGTALAQGGSQYESSTFTSAVPEPTTMVLAFVGLPLLGLYGMRRRARA